MSRSSSDEHSRAIDDKLPEVTVLFHTIDFRQAEIAYRQDRLRGDYRRQPGWFQRKLVRQPPPAQRRPTVRTRHAL
jgi:hypothetical protein